MIVRVSVAYSGGVLVEPAIGFLLLTVIVVVPPPTARTVPSDQTVATLGFEEVHSTVSFVAGIVTSVFVSLLK